jgi:hypothetical protein
MTAATAGFACTGAQSVAITALSAAASACTAALGAAVAA